MKLYLIEAYEENIDDYNLENTSVIGVASSPEKADKMIDAWFNKRMSTYISLEEKNPDLCDRAYSGIDYNGDYWYISIWITEKELDVV